MGWRSLFIAGGLLPLGAAIVLRFILPESPHFLARRERRWLELGGVLAKMGHAPAPGAVYADPSPDTAATKASIGSLFRVEFRRDTIALWGAFFSCLMAVYLGFSWLTTLLTGAGFDPATANSGIIAFNLGGVAGALAGGVAIARFGSRRAMLAMTLVAIGGAGGLALMEITSAASLIAIMAMLTLTGSMINGVQTTMYALAAHVYPTSVRATGIGAAVAFGRIGAVLTGFVGTWAVDYGGTHAFFGVVATHDGRAHSSPLPPCGATRPPADDVSIRSRFHSHPLLECFGYSDLRTVATLTRHEHAFTIEPRLLSGGGGPSSRRCRFHAGGKDSRRRRAEKPGCGDAGVARRR